MPNPEMIAAVQTEIEPISDYSLIWGGQSTFLLSMGGTKILTDPVSAGQLLPIAPGGYGKRLTPPGINIQETQPNIVVLSHSDPDHFEPKTLSNIAQNNYAIFVCPPTLANRLKKLGLSKVIDLKENESVQIENITVIAVHAEHRGNKNALGYIIQDQKRTVYFAGDTGYSGIKAIAEKYRPDLALLPIGEYPPPALVLAKWLISKGIQVPSPIMYWLKKNEKYKREKVHLSPKDVLELSRNFPKLWSCTMALIISAVIWIRMNLGI